MLEHIKKKYGTDKTAQIITYGKYSIRKLLTDASKSFGLPHIEAQSISKKIPADMSYIDIERIYTDKSALNELSAKEAKEVIEAYEKLQELFIRYPKVKIALQGLKHVISSVGCHAGGVCITGVEMFGELPTEYSTSDSAVLHVTQYDMTDIAKIHIVKVDLLGLQTVTILKKTMDMVGLGWEWYDSQDYSDTKVYEHLRSGYTKEIFQMEKPEPTRMMNSMFVENINNLSDVNAVNRPGGIATIDKLGGKSMLNIYEDGVALRLQGLPISFSFGIPDVDDYLKKTYGAILYQEDMMTIAKMVAGYDDGSVDKRIRKTIGKKLIKIIPEVETEFLYGKLPEKAIFTDSVGNKQEVFVFTNGIDEIINPNYDESYHKGYRPKPDINSNSPNCQGAQSRGYDIDKCITLFDVFIAYGSYGFNLSH